MESPHLFPRKSEKDKSEITLTQIYPSSLPHDFDLLFQPVPELVDLEIDTDTDKWYALQMKKKFKDKIDTSDKAFLTLTCTTEWKKLKQRLSAVLNLASYGVTKAIGCIETTKAGYPHAHLLLKSQRRLYKSKVTRTNGGDMVDIQRPRSLDNVYNYLRKVDTKIKDFEYPYPFFTYNGRIEWVPELPHYTWLEE